MITLSFKYSKNKNKNIYNYIYKKIREISKYRNYGNWTKMLMHKMGKGKKESKSKSKTKTKSKSNSKNKKKVKIYLNYLPRILMKYQ